MVWPFSRKSASVPETKSELTDPNSPSWAAILDMFASGASGVPNTVDVAMRRSPINAAVTIVSNATRTLPCKLYRTTDGGKEVDTEHAAYSLVHDSANDWQSAGQLRALVTTDAMLHGDGYAFVGKAGGKPTELIYLPRSSVVTEWDNIGRPSYVVDNKTYGVDEILHVQSPISLDGKRGLGLLQAGRDAIELSVLLERSAASLFRNNSRPGGVIMGSAAHLVGEDAGILTRHHHNGRTRRRESRLRYLFICEEGCVRRNRRSDISSGSV